MPLTSINRSDKDSLGVFFLEDIVAIDERINTCIQVIDDYRTRCGKGSGAERQMLDSTEWQLKLLVRGYYRDNTCWKCFLDVFGERESHEPTTLLTTLVLIGFHKVAGALG